MPTDVLKVSGDYKVSARLGTVTLDAPLTIVNGNLTVMGATTTIESINATIKDNIVVLNSGEVGPGVTPGGGTSGIMVARGNSDNESVGAFFYYDENFNENYFGITATGKWVVGKPTSTVGRALEVASLVLPSNINTFSFFSSVNLNAVLSVGGYTRGIGYNYESRLSDPDEIPNKAYVDSIVGSTIFAQKLVVGDSFVEINDDSISTSSVFYSPTPKVKIGLNTTSNIVLQLEGTAAQFYGLQFNDTTILSRVTGTNITVEPGGGGVIQLAAGIRIEKTPAMASTASYTGIYSTSTVGGGGTGLYYVNTTDTDELVSRKRAIIYGIIF
jgi:hypothetical protein